MKEFQLNKLGERVVLNVNGSPAVKNNWYPVNSSVTIDKIGIGYGEPYDTIDYSVRDNSKETVSNIGTMTVNYPVDKTISPSAAALYLKVNNEEINLYDYLSFSNGTDRIRIIDFGSSGIFKFGSSNVYKGQIIMIYDLLKLTFEPLQGQGNPYSFLTIQAGNNNLYTESKTLEIFKDSLAYLDPTVNVIDITEASSSFNILEGVVNKKALFKVEINTTSKKYFNSNYNTSVSINDKEINRIGYYEILVDLDNNGKGLFNVEVFSDEIIGDGAINFVIELMSIDGSSLNIDQSKKNKVIIINL